MREKPGFSDNEIMAVKTIGLLKERSLHRDLKQIYLNSQPESVSEAKVDSYIIDVKTKKELIEIQTKNLAGIKKKLLCLLKNHNIRLVHPVAVKKYICLFDEDGKILLSRRKSPKKGSLIDIVPELCRITSVLKFPGFSLEILFTEEEEERIKDGNGSWRRKGVSISDRKLISIIDRKYFATPSDYLELLPLALPERFTNSHIMQELKTTSRKASGITYCLKALNLLGVIEKRGNTQVFTRLPF